MTNKEEETWAQEKGRGERLKADALAEAADPGDVVMSSDAGAYQYHGDWAGVVTPDDPLATIEQAMRLYDVRWLALEGAHTVDALKPIMRGEMRPEWLSGPIVLVPSLPRTDEEVDEEPGADE